jgi:hypothetical protein
MKGDPTWHIFPERISHTNKDDTEMGCLANKVTLITGAGEEMSG